MNELVVVALGGNAILQPKQRGTAEEQYHNVKTTCDHIVRIIKGGYRVVVTHGNGPQVGNILIQNEEAGGVVPPMPLDVCGAESQGFVGYMIQQALGNALRQEGISKGVATVITQVVVDPQDKAFGNPTKPIGPFYTEEKARKLQEQKGYVMREDSGRGWRRVVPSPDPKGIMEIETIKSLVDQGVIVVCSGGGGVPVALQLDGACKGIEAVIDKDLAGQILATSLGADMLLILTDVRKVALNYRKPDEIPLDAVLPEQARGYLAAGELGVGSMAPKVEAAVRFVENGGRAAIIASLDEAVEAVEGRSGTWIATEPVLAANRSQACAS